MNWGLGLFSGYAILLVSQKRGTLFQVLAAISAVSAIVIGKYYAYSDVIKSMVNEEFGSASSSAVSHFSTLMVDSLIADFSLVFGGFDLIWVGLAILTAWRIPGGSGLSLTGKAD
jgi:hypothetical protein